MNPRSLVIVTITIIAITAFGIIFVSVFSPRTETGQPEEKAVTGPSAEKAEQLVEKTAVICPDKPEDVVFNPTKGYWSNRSKSENDIVWYLRFEENGEYQLYIPKAYIFEPTDYDGKWFFDEENGIKLTVYSFGPEEFYYTLAIDKNEKGEYLLRGKIKGEEYVWEWHAVH
jgi:hypothetical protein